MIQTKPHNFRDIFSWTEEGFSVSGITIPIIQRDYAQGRLSENVNIIRERFLKVLYDALVNDKKQTLDFVYGNIEDSVLTPLDGQQRLTTLFLLHYYIAKHEEIDAKEYGFLKNFTYETRESSKSFCSHLVAFTPDFSKLTLSEQIQDEAWFLLEWENDPTVLAMLVMLDSIHKLFCQTSGLWSKLMSDNIVFYFLPINDMGLTDELYIKMNSRGKPLTQFEHWKAELELSLKEVNPEHSKSIARKIDKEWTDLLWPYRNSGTGNSKEDNVIDDEFLRYIHFVSDILRFKNNEAEIENDFTIIKSLFNISNPKAEENASQLEGLLDIWCKMPNNLSVSAFFAEYLSTNGHATGKILAGKESDLFAECCRTSGLHVNKRRAFPFNRFLLLYAFVLYLQNYETITDDRFRRRLRILNNLINNSVDTLRADYIQSLMIQTEEIIVDGKLEIKEGKAHFNNNQLEEEIEKLKWSDNNLDKAEILYRLEDHPLLNGSIYVVGLDNIEALVEKFHNLFSYDQEGNPTHNLAVIGQAMLAVGDFGQKENSWRYQLGSPEIPRIWREMFGPTHDRSTTKTVLVELLSNNEKFDNESLKAISEHFVNTESPYTWRYYVVKYDSMRNACRYGKYSWRNDNQYSVIMMTTEISTSGHNYDVFLKTLYDLGGQVEGGLELDAYSYYHYNNEGADQLRIPEKDLYLTVEKDRYKIFNEQKALIEELIIPQDKDGNDIEDRIELGLSLLDKIRVSS